MVVRRFGVHGAVFAVLPPERESDSHKSLSLDEASGHLNDQRHRRQIMTNDRYLSQTATRHLGGDHFKALD